MHWFQQPLGSQQICGGQHAVCLSAGGGKVRCRTVPDVLLQAPPSFLGRSTPEQYSVAAGDARRADLCRCDVQRCWGIAGALHRHVSVLNKLGGAAAAPAAPDLRIAGMLSWHLRGRVLAASTPSQLLPDPLDLTSCLDHPIAAAGACICHPPATHSKTAAHTPYHILLRSHVRAGAGTPRRQVVRMGNKATGGPFAPLVVVVRNIVGDKEFNKLRGKAISLHSQGVCVSCGTAAVVAASRACKAALQQKNKQASYANKQLGSLHTYVLGPTPVPCGCEWCVTLTTPPACFFCLLLSVLAVLTLLPLPLHSHQGVLRPAGC